MIELLMKYCCSFLLLLLLGISGGFAQDKVECWGRYEISLPAKVKGNPFDIELTATFSGPDTTLTVRGFYDGNDTFKIRFTVWQTGYRHCGKHHIFQKIGRASCRERV